MDLAKNSQYDDVRVAALKKLDPVKWRDLISKLAQEYDEQTVCQAAIDHLEDRKLLMLIAKKGKYSGFREQATKRLKQLEMDSQQKEKN